MLNEIRKKKLPCGTIFHRSSYSNGTYTSKRWAKEYALTEMKIGSTCDYAILASVVGSYSEFTGNGLKYFPSVEYTYKKVMNKSYSRESVILMAKNKEEYQSIIRMNNEAHRKYFFRVPSVTADLIQQVTEEKGDSMCDVLIPTSNESILHAALGAYRDGFSDTSLEAFKGAYNAFEDLSRGNVYLLIDTPFKATYFASQVYLTISHAVARGFLDKSRILFSPIAYYPKNKNLNERDVSFMQQKIKNRPDFGKDSPLLDLYDVEIALKWLFKNEGWNEDLQVTLKDVLMSSSEFFGAIDFEYQLKDYQMPSLGIPIEEEVEVFRQKLLEGWNEKAVDAQKESSKRKYRGNWTCAPCETLEEVFQLGTKRSDRLKFEYDTIVSMGFVGYFLIVEDVTRFADENKLERNHAGRGSAAGCFISYLLGITGVDPIDSPYYDDLLFERFLNPSRVSMPDIDLDFSGRARDRVIAYLKQKYGENRVVVIGAYRSQRLKQVMKDVHKAFDYRIPRGDHLDDIYHITSNCTELSIPEMNRITRSIDKVKEDGSFEDIMAAACEESIPFKEFYEQHKAYFEHIVKPLCGFMRGDKSNHPSGYLILPMDVDDCLPIRFTNNDPTRNMISHYEMGECEDAGLIKLDVLNVNAVGMMAHSAKLVKKRTGKAPLSMNEIDLDDPVVLAEIQRDSYGIFQFKSEIQRGYLKQLQPSSFHHLSDSVALIRTGPMQAKAHLEYVNLVHGRQETEIDHPSMRAALGSTYGLIIYQEQVMRLAQDMAGFTLADADNLRRAIGKKKPEEMAAYRGRFVEGCVKNGIGEELAEATWDKIDFFSGYGFNMCVTGETTMTFVKKDNTFVHLPVAMVHEAMHINDLTNHISAYAGEWAPVPSEEFMIDVLQKRFIYRGRNEPRFLDVLYELFPSSNFDTWLAWQQFFLSDQFEILKGIMLKKRYGKILVYDEKTRRAIRNDIVKITRREEPSPLIQVQTATMERAIRVSPTHRFTVYSPDRQSFCDVMAGEIRIGDLLVRVDTLTEFKEPGLGAGFVSESVPVETVGMSVTNQPDYPLHDKSCGWDKTGVGTFLERVTYVDNVGEKDTIYELEMRKPYHRWFSSGVLSHNSHAVSYSIMGTYMGYLKAYFPNEYWCGVLTYSSDSTEMSNNIYELKTHMESTGIRIGYPHWSNFQLEYLPTERNGITTISWPLHSFMGISKGTAGSIYKASSKGKFESLEEFFEKNDPKEINMRVFKGMLYGAFFDDGDERLSRPYRSAREIMEIRGDVVNIARNRGRIINQYFQWTGRKGKSAEVQREQLIQQMRSKGLIFYNGLSAIKVFRYTSKAFFAYDFNLLGSYDDYLSAELGTRVAVGGVISRMRELNDRNGNLMAFLDIEDLGEKYSLTLFKDAYSKVLEQYGKLKVNDVIQIVGRKEKNGDWPVSIVIDEDGSVKRIASYDAVLAAQDPEVAQEQRGMHGEDREESE